MSINTGVFPQPEADNYPPPPKEIYICIEGDEEEEEEARHKVYAPRETQGV